MEDHDLSHANGPELRVPLDEHAEVEAADGAAGVATHLEVNREAGIRHGHQFPAQVAERARRDSVSGAEPEGWLGIDR
jgi:hypothetical protein